MVESLSDVCSYYLDLPVYRSEGMGGGQDRTTDYVDVVVLEVVQQFGVGLTGTYIALL